MVEVGMKTDPVIVRVQYSVDILSPNQIVPFLVFIVLPLEFRRLIPRTMSVEMCPFSKTCMVSGRDPLPISMSFLTVPRTLAVPPNRNSFSPTKNGSNSRKIPIFSAVAYRREGVWKDISLTFPYQLFSFLSTIHI